MSLIIPDSRYLYGVLFFLLLLKGYQRINKGKKISTMHFQVQKMLKPPNLNPVGSLSLWDYQKMKTNFM